MEHSTAIMEDAGNAIEAGAYPPAGSEANTKHHSGAPAKEHGRENTHDKRKRKRDHPDSTMRHGSRGGRDGPRRDGDNKRNKRSDMGRKEYFRDQPDKRQKTNDAREKRLAGKASHMRTTFTKEEIEAEKKLPKRKVAVLIGYAGTGYKGMQISADQDTIEGELFDAFVNAGAISKANADDPKKASLVRCARTDKGVHAAGNMISLKLIIEDNDIVEKINDKLPKQIRVWGIERTIGSFSSYQACDSRWYEYLIPSHAFLPPHPSSWLAKKLEQYAEDEGGSREGYESRQAEVKGFWENVDEDLIKPVLEEIDDDLREDVIKALHGEDEANTISQPTADGEQTVRAGQSVTGPNDTDGSGKEKTEEAVIIINDPAPKPEDVGMVDSNIPKTEPPGAGESNTAQAEADSDRVIRLRAATKRLRAAYNHAKRRYRIPQTRIDRIQTALTKFEGTSNYHNYTISKTYRDPSAKRHIKSFKVNNTPILIGDGPEDEKTEWLSLKVHGQSFMMHQIRKMVGMVTLLVRCGSDLKTLKASQGDDKYSIPKVPGLGLLLERPVFDSYNNTQALKHERPQLKFSKYETEIEAFKQKEIYQRIFDEEEKGNEFGRFFNHIDNFKSSYFLYVTSKGLEAVKMEQENDSQLVRAREESEGEEGEGEG